MWRKKAAWLLCISVMLLCYGKITGTQCLSSSGIGAFTGLFLGRHCLWASLKVTVANLICKKEKKKSMKTVRENFVMVYKQTINKTRCCGAVISSPDLLVPIPPHTWDFESGTGRRKQALVLFAQPDYGLQVSASVLLVKGMDHFCFSPSIGHCLFGLAAYMSLTKQLGGNY